MAAKAGNDNRIIALVDMDCFYVQVEQRRKPELRGKPCVVVQYKKWKGGGIIAVGYEARAFGVTRQMRGDDAKAKCPEVNLIYVPENRGKADLTNYRKAGAEVIKVLSQFSDCLERASIDEAFIDLSEAVKKYKSKYTIDEVALNLLKSTHLVSLGSPLSSKLPDDLIRKTKNYELLMSKLLTEANLNLAIGGIIANDMRAAVLDQTQFTCSAGIAHNKMLAKLIAGLHKPKQQTMVFQEDVPQFFKSVKIKKVRHLGGKLGEELQQSFKIETMAELADISIQRARQQFGEKTGDYLYWLGQGVDHEPIRIRQLPKSVGCCKNFRGREKLATTADVSYWLNQLASEVSERLEQEIELNNRIPTHLGVSLTNTTGVHVSRSCGVSNIDAEQLSSDVLKVINVFNSSNDPVRWDPPIILLGMSASKFVEYSKSSTKSIKSFFTDSPVRSSIFKDSLTNPSTNPAKKSGSRIEPSKSQLKCKQEQGLKRFFSSSTMSKVSSPFVSRNSCLGSGSEPSLPKLNVPETRSVNKASGDILEEHTSCLQSGNIDPVDKQTASGSKNPIPEKLGSSVYVSDTSRGSMQTCFSSIQSSDVDNRTSSPSSLNSSSVDEDSRFCNTGAPTVDKQTTFSSNARANDTRGPTALFQNHDISIVDKQAATFNGVDSSYVDKDRHLNEDNDVCTLDKSTHFNNNIDSTSANKATATNRKSLILASTLDRQLPRSGNAVSTQVLDKQKPTICSYEASVKDDYVPSVSSTPIVDIVATTLACASDIGQETVSIRYTRTDEPTPCVPNQSFSSVGKKTPFCNVDHEAVDKQHTTSFRNLYSSASNNQTIAVRKRDLILHSSFGQAGFRMKSQNDAITEDFVVCKKCGKRISAWELPEHNDFHFAQDLQHGMKNTERKNYAATAAQPPKKKVKVSGSIRSFFKAS